MTRICKLKGCALPVSGPRAEFCKPAHRAAFWRTQHVVAVVQVPGPRSGANARSGRQISFAKAVEAVAAYLARDEYLTGINPGYRDEAEAILREALPERQRERS